MPVPNPSSLTLIPTGVQSYNNRFAVSVARIFKLGGERTAAAAQCNSSSSSAAVVKGERRGMCPCLAPCQKHTSRVSNLSATQPPAHTDIEKRRDAAHNAQLAARYTQHTPGNDLDTTTRHKCHTRYSYVKRNNVKNQGYAALF